MKIGTEKWFRCFELATKITLIENKKLFIELAKEEIKNE